MAPWGFETFQDELACDWLEDLFDSDPIAFLTHCLDLERLDYIEYLAGIGVLCSAEIIHGLCAQPRVCLPRLAQDWLVTCQDLDVSNLLPAAIAGMDRVIGTKSEMRERWEDNEQWSDEWFRHQAELLHLLRLDQQALLNGSLHQPDES